MILSRVLLHPQERYNLEDYDQEQIDILTDSKYWTKEFLANASYILKGFTVSGVGAPSPCTVNMTDATLINANGTGEFSWFAAPVGATSQTVNLQPNQRNYLELELSTLNGTPLTRAFWDPSANGGAGAEFNQTVNTVTDIQVSIIVNTSAFTGSADRIPLAIVDTNNANTIKTIIDKRPMFFRLAQPGNPLGGYAWSSQTEPAATIQLSGVSGSFQVGETITFNGGATAIVTSGGSSPIQANTFSSDSFGTTITGNTSGANGTIVSIQDQFAGADKDIGNFRDSLAAIMTEIKALKGTSFWFQNISSSVSGAMKFINSCLVENVTANKAVVMWDGANLSLTDSNLSPASTDAIATLRILSQAGTINYRRQDGQAGTSKLAVADGEVLYVTLPASGTSINYSGQGAGSSNFKSIARASFISNDSNYWIAYREGSKLNFRGIGELQVGETEIIGDTIPQSLLDAIGLPDESSAPSYSSNIRGTAAESIIQRVGLLTDAVGDEQEDRSAFLTSVSPIVWTGTQLIFTSPILLRVLNSKNGTPYNVTIPTTFSPLTINNNSVIYFNLTRTTQTVASLIDSAITPIPAQSQAQKDVFILASRKDVTSGTYGEESDVTTQQMLHIPFHKQIIRNGQTSYLGEAGRSRNGAMRVDYHDPVSTTLPTGATVIIDGVAGVNGDLVVYSKLSAGNFRVYQLGGVGTAITWTAQYGFYTGLDPLDGEMVIVEKGNGYADQIGRFDGTNWNFNKTVRYFNDNGDYWELGAPITVAIANNTSANVFNVAFAGSQNWNIPYSLVRGLTKESGVILMTTDGLTVSVTKTGPIIGASGVTFSGTISGSNINLNYTSDNSGTTGTLRLFTMRWSDSAGGPGGIPSYTAGSGSSVVAAGNTGDIQFKDSGGGLAADDRFKVDIATGTFSLNGLQISALNGPTSILDNQPTFQTLFSYNAATYKRAIIEYSITRNGEERVGRLLISNNGSIAGQSDDFVETNQAQPTGIVLQAIYSGGNILVQYTSDSQGAGGQMYYSFRRW